MARGICMQRCSSIIPAPPKVSARGWRVRNQLVYEGKPSPPKKKIEKKGSFCLMSWRLQPVVVCRPVARSHIPVGMCSRGGCSLNQGSSVPFEGHSSNDLTSCYTPSPPTAQAGQPDLQWMTFWSTLIQAIGLR